MEQNRATSTTDRRRPFSHHSTLSHSIRILRIMKWTRTFLWKHRRITQIQLFLSIMILLRRSSSCSGWLSAPPIDRRRMPQRPLKQSTISAAIHQPVPLQHIEFGSSSAPTVGSSTEPPLVIFLHGLLGNKRNFASIGRSLGPQSPGRRFVSLDLRNHGDNVEWHEEMTYRGMAQDVIAWCQQHHGSGRQVELIGHSVGGKVAQYVSIRMLGALRFGIWHSHHFPFRTDRAVALLEPALVKGLVVLDIAPVQYSCNEPHWFAVTDIISALMNVSLSNNRRDVDQQLRTQIPDANLRAFCLTNVDWNTGQWKIPLHHIWNQLDHLAGFDVATEASSSPLVYQGDAFFIHGGQSKFVRSSHLPRIQEFFPNHMLTTIRGAGHWVHAEAPEDTTALIQRFLNR
jgi:esterase